MFTGGFTQKTKQQTNIFINDNNMTGTEIDFEDFSSWSDLDYTNYKSFISKLGDKLHQSNRKLIIDGPPISNSLEQSYYRWKYSDFNNSSVSNYCWPTYFWFDVG